jgi:hypothetical protein
MVGINNFNLDIYNLHKGDFVSSNGEVIIRFFLVENNSLILVQFILENSLNSVFFNVSGLQRIPKEVRYREYHGKEVKEDIAEYSLIETIEVNLETGDESIAGKVLKENEIVYECCYGRYLDSIEPTLWERFKISEQRKVKSGLRLEEDVLRFQKMTFREKVEFLRSKFRSIYKTRWELGIAPEECFLDKQEIVKYSANLDFKNALKEVLDLEKELTGKSVLEMYSNIIAQGDN